MLNIKQYSRSFSTFEAMTTGQAPVGLAGRQGVRKMGCRAKIVLARLRASLLLSTGQHLIQDDAAHLRVLLAHGGFYHAHELL